MDWEDTWKDAVNSIYEFVYTTVTSLLKTIIEFINEVAFKEPSTPEAIKTMINILKGVCASVVVCILLFKVIKNMIERTTGQSNTSITEIFITCIKTYLIILIMPIMLSFSMKYIIFPLGNWCFYSIENDFGLINEDNATSEKRENIDGQLYTKIDDFACTLPFSTINFETDYESFDFDNETDYRDSYPTLVHVLQEDDIITDLFGPEPVSDSYTAIICSYLHDKGFSDEEVFPCKDETVLTKHGKDLVYRGYEENNQILEVEGKIVILLDGNFNDFEKWCIGHGYCKKTGSGLLVIAVIEAFICFALGAFLFKLCIFYADIVYMGLFSIVVGISACTDDNSYVSVFWKEILNQTITICSQLLLITGFVSVLVSNTDVNSGVYWSKFMLMIGLLVLMLYQPHILKAVWYDTGAKKSMISFVKTVTRKSMS